MKAIKMDYIKEMAKLTGISEADINYRIDLSSANIAKSLDFPNK